MRKLIGGVLAATAAAGAFLAPAAASAAPAASGPRTYVFGAANGPGFGFTRPAIRAHNFYFGAGGNLDLLNIGWGRWGTLNARGRGTLESCAHLSCSAFPAGVVLSHRRRHGSTNYFHAMTIRWTAPSGQPRIMKLTYSRAGGTVPFWH